MGAINYGNNKNFITLGFDLRDYDSNNFDHVDGLQSIYNIIDEELKELQTNYYILGVKPGYYEGFYICFDLDYLYFYNYQEKQEALKQLTKIKEQLKKYISYGWLVACRPGWVDSWRDKKQSLKELNESIKKFRKFVNDTPTEKNYFKNWSIAR